IPLTVKIPVSKVNLTADNKLKNARVKVSLKHPDQANSATIPIFTATLADKALPTDQSPDIAVMTRLKIPSDPWNSAAQTPAASDTQGQTPRAFKTKLLASITFEYTNGNSAYTAAQTLTVQPEDCPPSNVSLLRLALQPLPVVRGKALLVKAVAPPVAAVYAGNAAPAPPRNKPQPPPPRQRADRHLNPTTPT